jgi:hypothetical protein
MIATKEKVTSLCGIEGTGYLLIGTGFYGVEIAKWNEDEY